jgi:hypothetical protein
MAQVAERDSADVRQPVTEEPAWFLPGVRMLVLGAVLILGGTPVSPGHARVIQLFGRYCGAIRDTGLNTGTLYQ